MADKWDNYHADFGPLYSFLENVFHKLSRKDVAAACIVAFFASSLLFFFEKAFRSIKMQQATLAPIVPDHLYLSRLVFLLWFVGLNAINVLQHDGGQR